MTTLKAFGDSNTFGQGVTTAQRWPTLLAAQLGHTLTMVGANGHMAKEQSYLAQGITPGDVNTVLLGTNDAILFGSSPTRRQAFIEYLRGLAVYLACTRVNGRAATIVSGTWSNTAGHYNGILNLPNCIGRNTSSANGVLQATVSGDAIYIGFTRFAHVSHIGKWEVWVDGNYVDTIDEQGATDLKASNYSVWIGMAAKRYAGFGAGSHVVQIRNVGNPAQNGFDACMRCEVDYIAGSAGAAKQVLIGTLPPMTPAWFGSAGNDAANIAAYNVDIMAMVAELASDGLNVRLANLHQFITTGDLGDGLHLGVAAHVKVKERFVYAATGPIHETKTFPFKDGASFSSGGVTSYPSAGSTLSLSLTDGLVNSATITP